MAQPDRDVLQAIPTDTRREGRFALWVAVLTLGGFLLWATLAELDSGAIAVGEVVPAGRVRTVQHLEGGMIQAIRVRDGDRVREGQELVVLDDQEVVAMVEIADRDLVGFRARLADIEREVESWAARSSSLGRLAANAAEETRLNRDLYEKNFISKPRLLQLESQHAQTEVTINENAAELARARQKKAEIEAAAASVRERRSVALQRLERTRIVAPQDGVVNNLKYVTLGGVIPPGGAYSILCPIARNWSSRPGSCRTISMSFIPDWSRESN